MSLLQKYASDGNIHCFMCPLSSWYYNICCVSVQDSCASACSSVHVNTVLLIWQLAPAGLHSDLDTDDEESWTDTNWTCWLTADTRVRKTQEQIWNSLRQLQQCSIIQLLQRVHSWLLLLMCLPWQNSCSHSSHLMTTPWDALPKSLLRNCPIRTALQFQCRHQLLDF